MITEPKYPASAIPLRMAKGNPFKLSMMIMDMLREEYGREVANQFFNEAKGNAEQVIEVCRKWVRIT